jgi:hypothetical protein
MWRSYIYLHTHTHTRTHARTHAQNHVCWPKEDNETIRKCDNISLLHYLWTVKASGSRYVHYFVVKEPIKDAHRRRSLYALSVLAMQAHRNHSYYGAFAFYKGPSMRSQFLLRSIVALLLGKPKT